MLPSVGVVMVCMVVVTLLPCVSFGLRTHITTPAVLGWQHDGRVLCRVNRRLEHGMRWSMQDLRGGADAERNKQIAALRKSFYTSEFADAPTQATERAASDEPVKEWSSLLGVLHDLPICRWGMVMLPGFNQELNVFQPMYTHMFESIIAKKQGPWYYVHLQTPGGTDNLMNPDYALRVGTKAPLIGVLMRIVVAKRLEDSRLYMVVQGLARVRVLEQTQKEPYARASVQLLQDAEITASYYPTATTELMGIPEERLGPGVALHQDRAACERWVHTVSHAAAVAAELEWIKYEVSTSLPIRGPIPQLTSFDGQAGMEKKIAGRAEESGVQAIKAAKGMVRDLEALRSRNSSVPVLGAPVLSTTDLVLAGVLGDRQSGASALLAADMHALLAADVLY